MLTAGNMVIRQNIYKENGKIMKVTMNFSLSYDDMIRFSSAEELRDFYRNAGCDGLEVMPLEPDTRLLVLPDMAAGIHRPFSAALRLLMCEFRPASVISVSRPSAAVTG